MSLEYNNSIQFIQFDHCVKKLRGVSESDAKEFESMLKEANRLMYYTYSVKNAWQMRKDAWAIYHQHFPSKKKGLARSDPV